MHYEGCVSRLWHFLEGHLHYLSFAVRRPIQKESLRINTYTSNWDSASQNLQYDQCDQQKLRSACTQYGKGSLVSLFVEGTCDQRGRTGWSEYYCRFCRTLAQFCNSFQAFVLGGLFKNTYDIISVTLVSFTGTLTHLSLTSHIRDFGKQCRSRIRRRWTQDQGLHSLH